MDEDGGTARWGAKLHLPLFRHRELRHNTEAVDVKQVGHELGVRYVLEGSVRKAGRRVGIAAQPIDATTGAHLWADRFDGFLENIFEVQDKVAVSVAGVIEPTLQAAEIRRSSERPTSDLPLTTSICALCRIGAHSRGTASFGRLTCSGKR
jgi:hypothetical protein